MLFNKNDDWLFKQANHWQRKLTFLCHKNLFDVYKELTFHEEKTVWVGAKLLEWTCWMIMIHREASQTIIIIRYNKTVNTQNVARLNFQESSPRFKVLAHFTEKAVSFIAFSSTAVIFGVIIKIDSCGLVLRTQQLLYGNIFQAAVAKGRDM